MLCAATLPTSCTRFVRVVTYLPGSCAPRQEEPGRGDTSTPPAAGYCRDPHLASAAGRRIQPDGRGDKVCTIILQSYSFFFLRDIYSLDVRCSILNSGKQHNRIFPVTHTQYLNFYPQSVTCLYYKHITSPIMLN